MLIYRPLPNAQQIVISTESYVNNNKHPNWGGVSLPISLFGVVPHSAWAEIQNSTSYTFCRRTHRIKKVSSTSAQQSRSLRVWKMLTPYGWASDQLYKMRWLTIVIIIIYDNAHTAIYRVSTDLTEQISRRFPGYSRRDFKKIQDMFALFRRDM